MTMALQVMILSSYKFVVIIEVEERFLAHRQMHKPVLDLFFCLVFATIY